MSGATGKCLARGNSSAAQQAMLVSSTYLRRLVVPADLKTGSALI